jgi:hypothetical protein
MSQSLPFTQLKETTDHNTPFVHVLLVATTDVNPNEEFFFDYGVLHIYEI